MALLLCVRASLACTNILVSPGAAADGHAHITYNADDANLYGAVSHWPAATHANASTRPIFSWDLGIYLGEIPQPRRTFNVMGNANDQGLVIGETTHGGLEVLSNTGKTWRNGTVLDYGQLIWVTLQRARTAREAIHTMTELANTYGYASSMEGFSIADADEVWYMELIGKGSFGRGVVWVALKVPEGYVSAHANQARITRFQPCLPADCLAAPDVVSFAVAHGLYDGAAADFSFSDVYDPLTFGGARFCEARVWYIFSQIARADDFDAAYYLPYARGEDLTRRMPLFVRPRARLSRARLHELMAHHFEASWFDPSRDVGAGAEHSPYRWNGLSWEYAGGAYVNERVVGVQYTAWHFVATVRAASVPPPMRAVLWLGVDDHAYAPKVPLHGGAAALHPSYDDANCTGRAACREAHALRGGVAHFSWDSAWWLSSLVADQVYTRLDRAAPVVREARQRLDAELEADLAATDAAAAAAFAAGEEERARALLDAHAVSVGGKASAAWKALWEQLVVQFIDGRITKLDPANKVSGATKEAVQFTDAWKAKVVADTGEHYKEPSASLDHFPAHRRPIPKLKVKGVLG
ncbi:hypothetical protein AB1Y20_015924 [Prymnesium parvum]|uniref:Dipeptidase n=1 Tax=Prymnesium parvum TaxID=97485 RepID=A0AB34K1W1_PRYPA